jgi:sRNA-binding protein
VASSTK